MQLKLPGIRYKLAARRFAVNSMALQSQFGQLYGVRRRFLNPQESDHMVNSERLTATPVKKLVQRIVTRNIQRSLEELKIHYKTLHSRYQQRKMIAAWEKAFRSMIKLGGASEGNHINVFNNGDDVFAHLWSSLDRAKKEILFETYIFESDKIGLQTLGRLIDASKRGVKVTLVLDSFGSIKLYDYQIKALENQGATVLVYNPVNIANFFRGPRRVFFRNHQKAVVIDDRVAFVGGMNVNEDYCTTEFGGNGRFRDTHARLEGPCVFDIKKSILDSIEDLFPRVTQQEQLDMDGDVDLNNSKPVVWTTEPLFRIPKYVRPRPPPPDVLLSANYVPAEISGDNSSDSDNEGVEDLICSMCPDGVEDGIFAQVLQSWRRSHLRHIQQCLKAGIHSARHEVLITNPYFMPPLSLKKALTDAAKRGVNVKILTCGPKTSDVPITAFGAQHIYHHFLKNGVNIFEYQQRILHTKSVIVDGFFTTIGSYNLDPTSEHRNIELNLIMLDRALAKKLTNHFEEDMKNAKEITLDDLSKRSCLSQCVSWAMYNIATQPFRILDGIKSPYAIA
jgi:cardiolipin synthase